MNKRKKRVSGFSVFLLTYSLILILLIAIGLKWVWGLLVDYENGLPEVTANRIAASFTAEKMMKALNEEDIAISAYETQQVVVEKLKEKINGKEITYRRNGADYVTSKPAYYMMVDNEPFAKFSLKQVAQNRHGFPVWEMEKMEILDDVLEMKDIVVKAPVGAKVYANGVLVPENTENVIKEPIDLAKNIKDYVEIVPEYQVYTLKGLYGQPSILVEGENIAPLVMDGEIYFYDYISDDAFLKENEELLRWLAEKYGGYLINRVSFNTLSQKLVGNAKQFLSDIPAIWAYLYGETYEYEITNFKTSNCKRYAKDCFSCDLEFTLSVHYRVTKNITYDTKLSCMFVLVDGEWKLADFIMG